MAVLWRGCGGPPYEVGSRLALTLDMAQTTGRSPREILYGDLTGWSEVDLLLVAWWKHVADQACPGCGRPMRQHDHNEYLGRAEEPADYMPGTIECPAQRAMAYGQAAWEEAHKDATKKYHDGNGPDPSQGVYWLAKGPGEVLSYDEGGESE